MQSYPVYHWAEGGGGGDSCTDQDSQHLPPQKSMVHPVNAFN